MAPRSAASWPTSRHGSRASARTRRSTEPATAHAQPQSRPHVTRVFVTGGSGFIGRSLVRQLRARGDDVTALVRERARGQSLTDMGATVIEGDVAGPVDHLAPMVSGHDAVVHVAGDYRIGIRHDERDEMWGVNVTAVERVIEAAVAVGMPRIVHVSTVNVFGNTRDVVVDETY